MPEEHGFPEVLSEFARTMATDFPIQPILDLLVVRVVGVLAVDAAGLTLIRSGRDPRSLAASDDLARLASALQGEAGEGPSLQSFEIGEPVAAPDLAADHRFPAFAPLAAAAGLGALFSFPLREGERRIGTLDLCRSGAGPLDASALSAALTLADVAAVYLSSARARSDLQDSADRARTGSLYDPLTGLPNRVLLGQRLEHAVLRARRSGTPVALLLADLDRFKAVNDAHGHEAGDELLIGVAERLGAILRPGDTLARLSGDEFAILCEDLGERTWVDALAARLAAALRRPFPLGGHEVTVTASVGIAFAGTSDDVPGQLLRDAGVALSQAKRQGGSGHRVVDLRAHDIAGRAGLAQDLHAAAARGGELRIDYQPVVTTSDGRITGMEALLRWDHPVLGPLSPATVVPLAEQSGLISDIGRWVLEKACQDRNAWARAHGRDDLTVYVNVSTRQLMSAGFVGTVGAILFDTRTEPSHLTLEITESVFVEDGERALVVLDGLKALGVTLALDDFGTGCSSLGYLQRFPVDLVKIDRGFVARLEDDAAHSVVVSSVVDMSHVLGLRVVAEGVETEDQHGAVEALGCDSCQGFYFARPMAAVDIHALMDLATNGSELRLPVRPLAGD